MSESLKPLRNRLTLRKEEPKKVSAGGLHLPDKAQEVSHRGQVLECGPDVEGIEPGDRVLYSKYAGVQVDVADETLLVLVEGDVLGKIEST